jgi:TRAP-type mannitol/chloroaromatic compound transport system substrate-binding protein
MGGWYRKEIRTPADFQGLKMRIGGFAGQVLAKLGVVAQQIAGGDIYPSLEKGTIDAAEWVGPYDDEKLGFNKVAKFYYYPGWWEGGPALHYFINTAKFNELTPEYKAALHAGCAVGNTWMMAKYDAQNPPALRKLVAGGTQLRPFPKAVMDACYAAAMELYEETSAKNANFKKLWDNMSAFQKEEILWFRVCENTYDNFMATAAQAKPAAAKKS